MDIIFGGSHLRYVEHGMSLMSNFEPARSADDHWSLNAACIGTETSTFYPADGERGMRRRVREAKAKAICSRCPVIAECLQWAIATNEPWGLWGGMTAEERAQPVIGLTA
jgi:WhiB family redox-sensing transcriptional regulator